jgi:hypothetical protein
MKTSTLLAIGAVGALILVAKSRKPGLGDADMLMPPPGRTVTASGQVLGGLGLLTTYQDAYDAAPSQYNMTPRNDFVPGLGRDWGDCYNDFPRQPQVGDTCVYIVRGVRRFMILKYIGPGGRNMPSTQWVDDTARQEAENRFQALQKQIEAQAVAARAAAQEQVNTTLAAIQKQADEEMARQAAAAEAERQAEIQRRSSALTSAAQPRIVHQQTNYDAAKAAAEQASMSQASSDTGYGRTSDDSGYGSTQQVTEEGAPKMPERIASVQTPSAIMLPEAKPAKPAGDSKVGLLVGGGVLAAIAAAFAS